MHTKYNFKKLRQSVFNLLPLLDFSLFVEILSATSLLKQETCEESFSPLCIIENELWISLVPPYSFSYVSVFICCQVT